MSHPPEPSLTPPSFPSQSPNVNPNFEGEGLSDGLMDESRPIAPEFPSTCMEDWTTAEPMIADSINSINATATADEYSQSEDSQDSPALTGTGETDEANEANEAELELGYLQDELAGLDEFEEEEESDRVPQRAQVYLKAAGDRVLVVLPPPQDHLDSVADLTWQELWHQLQQRLNAAERFWQTDTRTKLVVGSRLLDNSQLQDLEETLAAAGLQLQGVQTSRRETAIAAATAGYSVEQRTLPTELETRDAPSDQPVMTLVEPLYLRHTVRSGVEVRHPGTVIVFGDVNPGGTVIADGDVMVWGRLRGIVQAGMNGNAQAVIAALQMEPTQIRIADKVARAPSQSPDRVYPEVAYVTSQGIRMSRAEDFPQQMARLMLGRSR